MPRKPVALSPRRVLAFDQSYTRTGVCIAEEHTLLRLVSTDFPGAKTPKQKRAMLHAIVKKLFEEYQPDAVIVERIRMYSNGFVSMATIVSLHSLITTIVDASPIDVYSVDTRAWKSKILKNPSATKQDAIDFAFSLTGEKVNEDKADALCIAKSAFCGVNFKLET